MNNINIDVDSAIDEDFFGSLKGNKSLKLQQLFVEDSLSAEDKEQSLKYQRPKDLTASPNASSVTLMAKVVTAYKQGEPQGKVGLAVIQNPDHTCNIIMYKTRLHILVTLKLEPGKDLLYRQNRYWQFYDDSLTYWSFSFESPTDEEEFVEKLFMKSITFRESKEKENVQEKNLEPKKINNTEQTCDVENDITKSQRDSLIKRIGKVGKPLPSMPIPKVEMATEFSDSSDTEVINTSLCSSQKPFITPRTTKFPSKSVNQKLLPSIVGFNSVGNTVYPINPLESQYMQMLLTEQRTQSSELRFNMSKLENKIEKVLDKLEFCDRTDGKDRTEKDDEILVLEEKLLMVKKENKKLKQNLQEKSLEESNKIDTTKVLCEFREDFKKFNINYNQDLRNVLIDLNDKLKEGHSELQEMRHKIDENEQKAGKIKATLEREIIELQEQINTLSQRENELKKQLTDASTETIKEKHKVVDLQNELEEKRREIFETSNDALIKSIMNNLYLDIANKLNNINLPQCEQILSLIAVSIKEQTLKCLKK